MSHLQRRMYYSTLWPTIMKTGTLFTVEFSTRYVSSFIQACLFRRLWMYKWHCHSLQVCTLWKCGFYFNFEWLILFWVLIIFFDSISIKLTCTQPFPSITARQAKVHSLTHRHVAHSQTKEEDQHCSIQDWSLNSPLRLVLRSGMQNKEGMCVQ